MISIENLKSHVENIHFDRNAYHGYAGMEDHSSFWDQGFPALMITDTAFLRNPNYHLPSDAMDTLDFEFMRKVAIGIFHSVVELAK